MEDNKKIQMAIELLKEVLGEIDYEEKGCPYCGNHDFVTWDDHFKVVETISCNCCGKTVRSKIKYED